MQKNLCFLNKIFPKYSWFRLSGIVVLQALCYKGTSMLSKNWQHYTVELPIDSYIPFIPAFILPYVLCYAHWVINIIMSAHTGRERFNKFSTALMLSQIICGILFLVVPTTIVRPDVSMYKGVVGVLLKFIYGMDAPVNLFPSMHCLLSWFSWIAVRNCDNVPRWYQIFSLIFAIIVCISTVTVKQHFFVDIIGGVVLAETCWQLCNRLINNVKTMEMKK